MLAPVEAEREPVGLAGDVRREGVVEHPEQAALQLHGQALVDAHGLELDGDADPAAAVAAGAAQRRDEPEVVEDHGPDIEDEGLRRVERPLDHRDELRHALRRPCRSPWP